MARFRFPFVQTIKTRNGSLSKDAKIVNGYTEATKLKHAVVKRPGVTLLKNLPAAGGLSVGQGAYNFLGDTIAIVENQVFKVHFNGVYELIGTITGTIDQCYFTQSGNIAVPDLYYTSTLYPAQLVDGYSVSTMSAVGAISPTVLEGYSTTVSAPTSGVFYISVVPYNNYATEGYSTSASTLVGGAVGTVSSITYNNGVPEGYSTTSSTLSSGTLLITVITYNNYAAEGYTTSISTITSGTLG